MTLENEKELEQKTNEEFERITKLVQRRGLDYDGMKELLREIKKPRPKTKSYSLDGQYHKFIVFGDNHIGNVNYDPGLMKLLVKVGKEENVDFYMNTGDIADGWYQNRPASIFEQYAVGFDNQVKEIVKEFKDLDKPLFYITGNHSHNTYVRGAGVEIGTVLEDKLDKVGVDANFLGNAEGELKLGKTKLRMLHPDGGSSYAISYKSQKIVESLSGGDKPNALFIGHFHKAEYIFYRNIHTFQTATLCGQTKFMKGKGLAAHKGFWLIEMENKKNGEISYINPRFYPAYD